MSAFVQTLPASAEAPGPRLAVKNMIDVAGVVTSAGCAALAARRSPAARDAAVVSRAREAGAVVVGATVCDELGLGATGINPWAGTPTNPRDPDLVPGGSSSGSAAAVAAGEADIALGTDAGGSCRIPAACCRIAGLKTTPDRLPKRGIVGYGMALGSVGPMAPDVAGLIAGMRLVEHGFTPEEPRRFVIGRLRLPGTEPAIDVAVDAALDAADVDVREVDLPGFDDAYRAGAILIIAAAWRAYEPLLGQDGLSTFAADRIRAGGMVTSAQLADAEAVRTRFRGSLAGLFGKVDALALPTIPGHPPRLDGDRNAADVELSRLTVPFNLASVPAAAVPVPTDGAPFASLQLVTPHHTEERLLAIADVVSSG